MELPRPGDPIECPFDGLEVRVVASDHFSDDLEGVLLCTINRPPHFVILHIDLQDGRTSLRNDSERFFNIGDAVEAYWNHGGTVNHHA